LALTDVRAGISGGDTKNGDLWEERPPLFKHRFRVREEEDPLAMYRCT
jgi:hypothetical protein